MHELRPNRNGREELHYFVVPPGPRNEFEMGQGRWVAASRLDPAVLARYRRARPALGGAPVLTVRQQAPPLLSRSSPRDMSLRLSPGGPLIHGGAPPPGDMTLRLSLGGPLIHGGAPSGRRAGCGSTCSTRGCQQACSEEQQEPEPTPIKPPQVLNWQQYIMAEEGEIGEYQKQHPPQREPRAEALAVEAWRVWEADAPSTAPPGDDAREERWRADAVAWARLRTEPETQSYDYAVQGYIRRLRHRFATGLYRTCPLCVKTECTCMGREKEIKKSVARATEHMTPGVRKREAQHMMARKWQGREQMRQWNEADDKQRRYEGRVARGREAAGRALRSYERVLERRERRRERERMEEERELFVKYGEEAVQGLEGKALEERKKELEREQEEEREFWEAEEARLRSPPAPPAASPTGQQTPGEFADLFESDEEDKEYWWAVEEAKRCPQDESTPAQPAGPTAEQLREYEDALEFGEGLSEEEQYRAGQEANAK